ncbi:MAG: hypothetical protein QM796_09345 [Chthoniobacteraceae bacterium]
MKIISPFILVLLTAVFAGADTLNHAVTEQIGALTDSFGKVPVTVTGDQRVTTKASFRPPLEITIVARTDSKNLRMSYAADEVIFNWERNEDELRVDGGPANGDHQGGKGRIPTNTDVTIRWVVTQDSQQIYVNDDLRFEHHGDYARINNPISIFSGDDSKVTVTSIKTKPL